MSCQACVVHGDYWTRPDGECDACAQDDAMTVNPNDEVSHPRHYTSNGSGIECIQVTEHMNFCRGNAIKYIWRAGLKSEDVVKDLRKAIWYLEREIERLERGK